MQVSPDQCPRPKPEDLQFVDNVLSDRPDWQDPNARRRLMTTLAVGGAALASVAVGSPAFAAAGGDTDQAILNIADTAEHLAVTYLGYVIADAGLPANVNAILAAARFEEYVHLQVLEDLGARPLTTVFSLPQGDLSYVTDGIRALETIEATEGIFVGAYLAAVAQFAARGNWRFAQYAAEIMGVEAEHRALARFALGATPANNLAFEDPSVPSVSAAAKLLGKIGFLSPTPANSYAYPGPGGYNAAIAQIQSAQIGIGDNVPTNSRPPSRGAR